MAHPMKTTWLAARRLRQSRVPCRRRSRRRPIQLRVPKTATPPIIDGVVSDDEWAAAPVAGPFIQFDRDAASRQSPHDANPRRHPLLRLVSRLGS